MRHFSYLGASFRGPKHLLRTEHGLWAALGLICCALGCKPTAPDAPVAMAPLAADAPRLTVVLVVDQMRGEEMLRYEPAWHFGVRRLLDGGRVYTQAMHTHGDTSSAAGHATIATGLLPKDHGVVDERLYLAARKDVVDICQMGAKGCDATALLRPTLGERLKQASADSRVVAVADRAASANLLAGNKADLLVWMQEQNVALQARSLAGPGAPPWLQTLFGHLASAELIPRVWRLPAMPKAMASIEAVAPGSVDCGHGLRFPHRIPSDAHGAALMHMWRCTPDSDRAILQTALQTAQHMALGKDDAPDMLYVSLGATARVGEAYGYESLERAATLVALDQALGEFLDSLIEDVGPRVLVLLTSDQGLGPKALHRQAEGHRGGRLDPHMLAARLEAELMRFGPGPHVAAMLPPFVHLNAPNATVRAAKASAAAVSLGQVDGVYKAWTPPQMGADPDPIARLLVNSYSPQRSGDVVFAMAPYFAPGASADPQLGARSGSPWPYDRHVPLILYGYGIAPGHVDTEVSIIDAVRSVGDSLGLAAPADGGKPLAVPLH